MQSSLRPLAPLRQASTARLAAVALAAAMSGLVWVACAGETSPREGVLYDKPLPVQAEARLSVDESTLEAIAQANPAAAMVLAILTRDDAATLNIAKGRMLAPGWPTASGIAAYLQGRPAEDVTLAPLQTPGAAAQVSWSSTRPAPDRLTVVFSSQEVDANGQPSATAYPGVQVQLVDRDGARVSAWSVLPR